MFCGKFMLAGMRAYPELKLIISIHVATQYYIDDFGENPRVT